MAIASVRNVCRLSLKSFTPVFSSRYLGVSARNRIESSSQSEAVNGTESDINSNVTNSDAAAKSLKDEKDKLSQQLSDLQDKYKRSLAETENVRMRMKKQVDDAKLFGVQNFCKDLLEVADILAKATESAANSQKTDSSLEQVQEGLRLTELQLLKVFEKHGLVRISPAEGEKFDPNIHEALFQQPANGNKVPGTVAVVSKIGYKLHSRTLRPALVGVFG